MVGVGILVCFPVIVFVEFGFFRSGYFQCYFLQFFDVYMCYFYVEIVFVGGLGEGKRTFVFSFADFSVVLHSNIPMWGSAGRRVMGGCTA